MQEPLDNTKPAPTPAPYWAVHHWSLGDLEQAAWAAASDAVHRLERAEAAAVSFVRRVAAAVDAEVNRRVDARRQADAARVLLVTVSILAVAGTIGTALVGQPEAPVRVDTVAGGEPAAEEAIAATPPAEGTQATAPAPAIAPAASAPPVVTVPARRGALPVGKGMWLYVPEKIEGGDVQATIAKARAVGLTHLYVRTGSSRMGFYAADYLNRLLPEAHAHGIRVYGWDFPYLTNVADDVNRSLAAITYTTPGGHRIDGFAADIELRSMGVNITPDTAWAYGEGLRRGVGSAYPLIAVVPRPSPALVTYPFPQVAHFFDAVAPMVYWLNREPVGDVEGAFRDLAVLGKPILPVGQAYDGLPEGGKPGVPPRAELLYFMEAAERLGAPSVSFWSWQHADGQAWDAIRDASWFQLPAEPAPLSSPQLRAYQFLLNSLGFAVAGTGVWDMATVDAVATYQQAAGLPVTGHFDEPTRTAMFTPFAPPIRPGT